MLVLWIYEYFMEEMEQGLGPKDQVLEPEQPAFFCAGYLTTS